ncbi:RTA1 like protein-domain-containing protein [Hypoxylon sp. FL0543]|nr:RTA1 like protein-domain-containing protein [Hypoxylon sp. FL0543]
MPSIASCNFDTCPVAASPYGYPPSSAAEAIFLIIHVGSLIACLLYSFFLAGTNRWLEFSIPISIACFFESVGYGVRLASSFDPWNVALYATSTAFIIVAPAFVSAAIYFTVPEAINILGVEHSLINITHYPLFIWIDVVGFVLQLVGIIISFSDLSADKGLGEHAHVGSPIIAAGTAIQAISLVLFLFLFSIVLLRAAVANSQFGYTTFHPVHGFVPIAHRFKFFLAMLLISAMCLFARALYQTIVLGDGLGSWTAKNQALFAGLDSLLVGEAVVGLVVAHPVRFLRSGLEKRRGSGNTSMMVEEPRVVSEYYLGGHQLGTGTSQHGNRDRPQRPNRRIGDDLTPLSSRTNFV